MTDKARELLERSAEILELLFEGPNDVDPNTLAMLGDTRLEEIRAYLASEKQDQPEPVRDEEPFGFYFEPTDVKDNWFYPCFTRNKGKVLKTPFPHKVLFLYLHPAPQRSFVRLSEEELRDALRVCPHDTVENIRTRWLYAKDFARAIEDALEEKNK